MKWSGLKQPLLCVLMAQAVDSLATLVWMNTEDGINGVNRPTMISPTMIDGQIKEKSKTGYDTPEEFMEAMRKYEGGEQG